MFLAVFLLALAGVGVALSNGVGVISNSAHSQIAAVEAVPDGASVKKVPEGNTSVDEIVDKCYTDKTRNVDVKNELEKSSLYLSIEEQGESGAPTCLTCFDHPTETVTKDGIQVPARICIESEKDDSSGGSKLANNCGNISALNLSKCAQAVEGERRITCSSISTGNSSEFLNKFGLSCGESMENVQKFFGDSDKSMSQLITEAFAEKEAKKTEETVEIYKSKESNIEKMIQELTRDQTPEVGSCDGCHQAKINSLYDELRDIGAKKQELEELQEKIERLLPEKSTTATNEGGVEGSRTGGNESNISQQGTFNSTKTAPGIKITDEDRSKLIGEYSKEAEKRPWYQRLIGYETERQREIRRELEQRGGGTTGELENPGTVPKYDDDYYEQGELGVGQPTTNTKPPTPPPVKTNPKDPGCTGPNCGSGDRNGGLFGGLNLRDLAKYGGLLGKLLGGLGGGGGGSGGGQAQNTQAQQQQQQDAFCTERYPGTKSVNGRCTCPSEQVFSDGECRAKDERNTSGSGELVAELSCSPKAQDDGAPIAISFACRGPKGTTIRADGFEIESDALSGAASALADLDKIDPLTKIQKFAIMCIKDGETQTKSCEVQVNKAALVSVAKPSSVNSGEQGKVGWLSAGAKRCEVRAAGDSDEAVAFNNAHQNTTQINGTAITPPLTEDMEIVVSCETHGGAIQKDRVFIKVL